MIKSGFTLLELIISLAIAAILSVCLTMFLAQSNKYQVAVQDRTSVYTRASVVLHQLEKDLSGAHIPIQNIISQQQEEEKKQKKAPQQKKPEQTPEQPAKQDEQTKKEEQIQPINRVFYLEQKDKKMHLLTFITNNPLKVYWSSSVGAPKPSLARVVYYLKPDPEHADSFILMRQEGTNLDFAAYDQKSAKAVRAYELIDGIQSCSIRLVVIEPEEPPADKDKKTEQQPEAKKEKSKPAPKQAPKIIDHYTWNWPNPEKTKKEDEKEPSTPMPQLASISLTLWDAVYDRTVECTYTVPLYAAFVPPAEPKKQEEKPQEAPETAAPGAQKGKQQGKEAVPGIPVTPAKQGTR